MLSFASASQVLHPGTYGTELHVSPCSCKCEEFMEDSMLCCNKGALIFTCKVVCVTIIRSIAMSEGSAGINLGAWIMQADKFHKTGRQLRSKMWWQNMKMKILVVMVVLILIFIIFLIVCFAGSSNCIKH